MQAFKIVTILIGLVPLWFGVNGVLFGAAEQMGGDPFSAAMDNQYRYLSGIYIGVAVMVFYSAGDIRARASLFRFAMLFFFIGGCARLVSVFTIGDPPIWQLGGMVAELGAPLLLLWQDRVIKG